MISFPLLLIPLAICNIIVFLMPGVSFGATLVSVPLPSGAAWTVSASDVLLSLGTLLLLLEVVKGARPGVKYLVDHLLSLLVFAGAAAEFALLPQFANSTFFLLSLLALVEFLAGMALRRQAPRAVHAESPAVSAPMRRSEEPVIVPPTPAPAIPAAASVAEAILLDHPEPRLATSVAHDSSPQIASPDLQPGNEVHPPSDPPAR